jgi:lysyl-tRNA synthetase class 2
MSIPEFDEIIEPNDQTAARAQHLAELRALVGNVYPNRFERSRVTGDVDTITRLMQFGPVAAIAGEMDEVLATLDPGTRPPADVKDRLNERLRELGTVRVAGRLAVPPRVMGKAAFVHLSDGISRLQIYCRKEDFVLLKNDSPDSLDSQESWAAFGLLDHGDFIGVEGFLFITNTGELSVHVEKLKFLAKAMVPMPDKMHGIADPEIRQRQRYADLIASSLQIEHEGMTTREVFETRAKVISSVRRFLEDHGYIEVETPMLTPKATGAAAKPFQTHHNALDITLYARIAPELYLKRLVVGGFEKVYELNRNFRNEGISFKHNPEFTMLDFYCAYMDVNGMMDFCEELLRESVEKATGGLKVEYEGKTIDFSSFERVAMREGINTYFPAEWRVLPGLQDGLVDNTTYRRLHELKAAIFANTREDSRGRLVVSKSLEELWSQVQEQDSEVDQLEVGLTIEALFEDDVEPKLIQPTFVIDYPKAISPLSKASPEDPAVAERFELFINGMEVANGFSELNDPREQYDRFIDQMAERERGDEEAMVMDEDYIRALSYGMPPAAGIGIGIDRLVMLLTNKHSIRDVILFPHLRPERKAATPEDDA